MLQSFSFRKHWKSTFSFTQLSFDAPSPGNPREYPHKALYCEKLESLGFAADGVGLSSFKFSL